MITVLGMVPYAGLSFSSFEQIKRFVLNKKIKYLTEESIRHTSKPSLTDTNRQYYELTVLGKLLCGAFTGIIAQTITYPMDVVRRHMQLSTMLKDAAIKQ